MPVLSDPPVLPADSSVSSRLQVKSNRLTETARWSSRLGRVRGFNPTCCCHAQWDFDGEINLETNDIRLQVTNTDNHKWIVRIRNDGELNKSILDHLATDLIDLSTPGTRHRDSTVSDDGQKLFRRSRSSHLILVDTDRQEHGTLPSMNEILLTAAAHTSHVHHLSSDEYDDHLVRYSELATSNLESKPITEKMDHWYLDLKKNLMVTEVTACRRSGHLFPP